VSARLRPLLLALLLGCASCGSTASVSAPVAPVAADATDPAGQVELDVFSGRPNPTWTLSDADRADLRARLDALPAASATELGADLGYRGFVVRMPAAEGDIVTVRRGSVHVSGDGHGTGGYYRDPDRGLERWLLTTGGTQVGPEVAQLVEQELGA
jgi:hypothetical protein